MEAIKLIIEAILTIALWIMVAFFVAAILPFDRKGDDEDDTDE